MAASSSNIVVDLDDAIVEPAQEKNWGGPPEPLSPYFAPVEDPTTSVPSILPPSKAIQDIFQGAATQSFFDLPVRLRRLAEEVSCRRPFKVQFGRGSVKTTFQLINASTWQGSLLMKSEDLWLPPPPPSPAADDEIPSQGVYEIAQIVENSAPICNHRTWATEYPQFLVSDDARRFQFQTIKLNDLSAHLQCVFNHWDGCNCNASTHWGAV
ncbi:hypothetical protein QBC42DRAFT_248709 [Cladorrhinum samala]|uniref:Uncharacterized protein n=1 Tax=Cladorrhinum samala TaxID=585594 RepID=A0AAV9I058_9PEZI|nr:hypothetical protein QBC42DRAFT_248709 [Cladorrhinum samala]